jgi:predicted DNA-binding protein
MMAETQLACLRLAVGQAHCPALVPASCFCLAPLSELYYKGTVKTLTMRIDEALDRRLASEAKRLGRTKSDLARQALREQLHDRKPVSLHDRMKDVCGIIKAGPRDLSTNPKYLEGFGQ